LWGGIHSLFRHSAVEQTGEEERIEEKELDGLGINWIPGSSRFSRSACGSKKEH